MGRSNYATDVFINCPFDPRYHALFEAIVFAVFDCGFRARCALEVGDASEVRIDKIFNIIAECRFGIHDLSRTDLDPTTNLPRFNMPLELGLFLSAKRFGQSRQKRKVALILDRSQYRYQKFISDIAGQDIQSHRNSPKQAITVVRNWLRDASKNRAIPGGIEIFKRYQRFLRDLPQLCEELRLARDELTFNDYAMLVSAWLKEKG